MNTKSQTHSKPRIDTLPSQTPNQKDSQSIKLCVATSIHRSSEWTLLSLGWCRKCGQITIPVHTDVEKRDEFLRKAVKSGRSDIDFFFDVNTSKYYIYYKKFNNISEAKTALNAKGNKPYNSKMSMVKIEK